MNDADAFRAQMTSQAAIARKCLSLVTIFRGVGIPARDANEMPCLTKAYDTSMRDNPSAYHGQSSGTKTAYGAREHYSSFNPHAGGSIGLPAVSSRNL